MKLRQVFSAMNWKYFILLLSCLALWMVVYFGILDYFLLNEDDSSTTLLYDATEENPRLKNFRRDWLRQRRTRVDWEAMMKSCKDYMAWNPVTWDKIHRSDVSTSEIVLWDIKPAGEFSKIFIQSRTSDNRTKMIGGDTWRVYLRGPSKVAATMIDHNNGTYEALFLLTEPGVYSITVRLDYSLCDGFRDPPNDWFIKGNTEGKYQNFSMLGRPLDHMLFQSKTLSIMASEAQLNSSLVDKLVGLGPCSRTCKYLSDGFGQWTNNKWRPYLEGSDRHFHLVPNDELDFQPDRIIKYIVDVLQKPEMQQGDGVLLLNIGLHYPISINFTTYQMLIQDVITTLKKTDFDQSQGKRVPKYKAKVIWKSTTAIVRGWKKHFPFLTTQRNLLFSAYATSAMCEAGFDVIDLFPMTASNPESSPDGFHYTDKVFDTMEAMLERNKALDNTESILKQRERTLKQCIS